MKAAIYARNGTARIAFVVLLLFPLFVAAVDKSGDARFLIGTDQGMCASYVIARDEARNGNHARENTYRYWLYGYITGLNLGIPDNYALPIPSLFLFGFDFDSRFLTLTGTRMWKGLLLADEQLRRDANLQHLSIGQHKEILRERYRASIATLKTLGIIKEN